MANRNTRRTAKIQRKYSKANLGEGFVPFGRTVDSSAERKAAGKKPWKSQSN